MTTGFLGMRGTGTWGPNEAPQNWRQGVLYEWPNGSAPLTAVLSMIGDKSTDDYRFHWWTKELATQGGPITGVFTNVGLTTAYVSGGVIDSVLYIRMADVVASEIKPTHQVLLRSSTDPMVDVNAYVLNVVRNGANSYIGVRLLENDDNSATHDLSDANTLKIVGNINPQGGPMPAPISYAPLQMDNKTQIFRTSLSITETARNTNLRTEDDYRMAKREALQYHSIEIENAFIWGVLSERIGDNGQPETTTMGIVPCIKQFAPQNVADYTTDPLYNADSWITSGEQWLDEKLELVFRRGAEEKLVLAGSGAVLGLNRLAKNVGFINLTPQTAAYGLQVLRWITPFGVINIKTHPLLSYDPTTSHSMIILEPRGLLYRYLQNRDTHYIEDDKRHGWTRVDAINEEYLTECGLEFHFPSRMMYLTGVGLDNILP